MFSSVCLFACFLFVLFFTFPSTSRPKSLECVWKSSIGIREMIQLLLRHSLLVIVLYCLFSGLCLNLDVLNSSLFSPSRISMTVYNRICSVINGAGGLMLFRKIARLCLRQRFEFNCYLFSLTQSTFFMKGKKIVFE